MSRSWRVWPLVGALVLLHFLLRVGFVLGAAAPDLLTVALLLAAREVETGWASALGFLFGLLEDALSVLTFGANTIAMTVVGLGGAYTRDLFVGDSRFFVMSYFFLGKWLRDLGHWMMVGDTVRQPFVDQVIVQGGLSALYASLVGTAIVALWGLSGES